MVDGHPWSPFDNELFDQMRIEEQNVVLNWIHTSLIPRKNACHGHTSYGIKHLLERDTGIYMQSQMKQRTNPRRRCSRKKQKPS